MDPPVVISRPRVRRAWWVVNSNWAAPDARPEPWCQRLLGCRVCAQGTIGRGIFHRLGAGKTQRRGPARVNIGASHDRVAVAGRIMPPSKKRRRPWDLATGDCCRSRFSHRSLLVGKEADPQGTSELSWHPYPRLTSAIMLICCQLCLSTERLTAESPTSDCLLRLDAPGRLSAEVCWEPDTGWNLEDRCFADPIQAARQGIGGFSGDIARPVRF